jgi:hypothetical protein
MAIKKVGKYKVGKHELDLWMGDGQRDVSLDSGQTLDAGSLTNTGAITITGSAGSTPGLMRTAPVLIGDTNSSESLSKGTNGGRTNAISMSAQRYYSLPTPGAAGEYYHFIYTGANANSHQFTINTNLTSETMTGNVQHLSTEADSGITSSKTPVGTENSITASLLEGLDLHFLASSTTNWKVWGNVTAVSAGSASFRTRA